MHLSPLVIGQWILLETGSHQVVGDFDVAFGERTNHQVEDVEQFSGVATAVAQQGLMFFHGNVALFQFHIFGQRPVQQLQQVVFFQRFQHIQLAA